MPVVSRSSQPPRKRLSTIVHREYSCVSSSQHLVIMDINWTVRRGGPGSRRSLRRATRSTGADGERAGAFVGEADRLLRRGGRFSYETRGDLGLPNFKVGGKSSDMFGRVGVSVALATRR